MEEKELMEELSFYKSKSNFTVKFFILLFSLIERINNQVFYLVLSLSTAFLLCYIFNINYLSMLICHFILWITLGKKLFNQDKMVEENKEISFLIKELKKHLKNKKGVN
jgi:hypothetical protein